MQQYYKSRTYHVTRAFHSHKLKVIVFILSHITSHLYVIL